MGEMYSLDENSNSFDMQNRGQEEIRIEIFLKIKAQRKRIFKK